MLVRAWGEAPLACEITAPTPKEHHIPDTHHAALRRYIHSKEAEASTRPNSDWDFATERASLQTTMNLSLIHI